LALCFAEKSFEMTPTQKQIRDALRRAKEMDAANCNMCGGLDAESLKTVISVLSASLWNTDMSQAPKDGSEMLAKDNEGQYIVTYVQDGWSGGRNFKIKLDGQCILPTAWKPLLGDE
jgi:hypothetical protein